MLLPIVAVSLGGVAGGGHPADEGVLDTLMHQGDSLLSLGLRTIGVSETVPEIVATALVNVGLLVALVFLGGKRLAGWMFDQVERFRSEELFTLGVVVVALFVAVIAKAVFGLSDALGAFLAGVMIGDHRLAHRIAEDVRPIRDLFGIIFFAAVGMLLDPAVAIAAPLALGLVLAIIVVAKPLIAAAVVFALRQPPTAIATIAPGLGQVGEFSFILAVLGRSLGLLPEAGYQLIISGAIISIALNPLLFQVTDRLVGRRGRAEEVEAEPAAAPA